MDFTDPNAIEMLSNIKNIQVRVIDSERKKLHAKAYFFTTDTERYLIIGSSNLTEGALNENIEWNAALLFREYDEEYQRAIQAYNNLWESAIKINNKWIEQYRVRYEYSSAFKRERAERDFSSDIPVPRYAQIDALKELKRTRRMGKSAALIVMATGLGKTHLAAFDSIEYHKILYIAHVKEILEQAEIVFNDVRRFGRTEQFSKGWYTRDIADVLFATVQKISRKTTLEKFKPDEFDYIIIDEFHHAQAKSYRKIIEYFRPKFLLGITATPFRMDRKDISELCDRNIPYSCNMAEAINNDWLSTFTYYGVYDDTVDYSKIKKKNKWEYDETELENALIYDKRADYILTNYHKYQKGATLAFCVGIEHANYMTEYFNNHGVSSIAVHSGANRPDFAREQVNNGNISVIFAVNIFNEGIDFPDIRTVMFLRPTQSITVFIQQLGRGLRKTNNKDRLIVVDFVGNYERSFVIPALITGSFYPHLNNEMYAILIREFKQLHSDKKINKNGNNARFKLPKGVEVNFDIKVIDNMLERLEKINPVRLGYIQTYLDLKRILNTEQVSIEQMLQQGIPVMNYVIAFKSWWNFLKEVGDLTEEQQGYNKEELEMLKWLEHKFFEKTHYFDVIKQILDNDMTVTELIDKMNTIQPKYNWTIDDIKESIAPIKVKNKKIKLGIVIIGDEIVKSKEIRWDFLRTEIKSRIELKNKEVLREFVIGHLYTREQINKVLIYMGNNKIIPNLLGNFGQGIVDVEDLHLLLLLVNLIKDKDAKEANINYNDIIIDPRHMKWESQNRTTLSSKYGQILTEKKPDYEKLMFVRLKKNASYFNKYYFYLGKVKCVSYSDEKPIKITWRFEEPLNEFLYDYLISAREDGDIPSTEAVETPELFPQKMLEL